MTDYDSWRSLPSKKEAQGKLDELKAEFIKNGGTIEKFPRGYSMPLDEVQKIRDSRKIEPDLDFVFAQIMEQEKMGTQPTIDDRR